MAYAFIHGGLVPPRRQWNWCWGWAEGVCGKHHSQPTSPLCSPCPCFDPVAAPPTPRFPTVYHFLKLIINVFLPPPASPRSYTPKQLEAQAADLVVAMTSNVGCNCNSAKVCGCVCICVYVGGGGWPTVITTAWHTRNVASCGLPSLLRSNTHTRLGWRTHAWVPNTTGTYGMRHAPRHPAASPHTRAHATPCPAPVRCWCCLRTGARRTPSWTACGRR